MSNQIEIREKGQIIAWHFDTIISNLPAGKDYVQENIDGVKPVRINHKSEK